MARYDATIRVPRSIESCFEYLSDFANTAEWDPGVVSAQRLSPGPLEKGAEFRVVASFLGRQVELDYTLTEYDPPHRLVFEGEGSDVISIDEILLEPAGKGTSIHWQAELTLKGWRRYFDPLLVPALRWIGDNAVEGLKRTLRRKGRAASSPPVSSETA